MLKGEVTRWFCPEGPVYRESVNLLVRLDVPQTDTLAAGNGQHDNHVIHINIKGYHG